MDIRLKRAYDHAARSDGPRILVDRIWPRGVAKEDADIAHWLKGLRHLQNCGSGSAMTRTDGPGFETATSKSSSLMGPQRT